MQNSRGLRFHPTYFSPTISEIVSANLRSQLTLESSENENYLQFPELISLI